MFRRHKPNPFKPNPFVLTFDDEADGGPTHILHLLVGYCVRLRKDGVALADILVTGVDDEFVAGRPWSEKTADYDGPITFYNVWNKTFDEVMYL